MNMERLLAKSYDLAKNHRIERQQTANARSIGAWVAKQITNSHPHLGRMCKCLDYPRSCIKIKVICIYLQEQTWA
jgi:hypothetical protein